MRIINRQNIQQVYSHEMAIQDCLHSYSVVASNKVISSVRTTTQTPNQDFLLMPAAVKGDDHTDLALKMLSIVPKNKERGLPLIVGKVIVIDEKTGNVEALLDGQTVTLLRTGAVAGAMSKLMHPNPVENVVIFGCGAQGRAGIDSILFSHPELKNVYCFDYFPDCAKSYAKFYNEKYPSINFTCDEQVEKAVRCADLIHCATTSKEALFDGDWVKNGAQISAIGAYKLDMHELPTNIFSRKNVRVFIEEKEACESEAGDVMKAINEGVISWDNIHLIGDVVNGVVAGRENDEQITITKVVGVAAQDVVASKTIVKAAKEQNVGVLIEDF